MKRVAKKKHTPKSAHLKESDLTQGAELAAPSTLTGPARDRWEAVIPLLAGCGPVDLGLLETYCQVWARWRQAEDALARSGPLLRDGKGGVKTSPLVAIAGKLLGQVQRLERRLGIAAAEAAANKTQPPQDEKAEVWRHVDRIQLALLIGVHPDTVTDFTRQGMPIVKRGGQGRGSVYDAVACLAWWREHQGNLNTKERAQTRAYEATAKLNEQRLAERRGELVSRDAVILAGKGYTKAWAAKIRALPRRMIETGLLTRQQEGQARSLCHEVLTEIANWKTVKDVKRVTEKRKARA